MTFSQDTWANVASTGAFIVGGAFFLSFLYQFVPFVWGKFSDNSKEIIKAGSLFTFFLSVVIGCMGSVTFSMKDEEVRKEKREEKVIRKVLALEPLGLSHSSELMNYHVTLEDENKTPYIKQFYFVRICIDVSPSEDMYLVETQEVEVQKRGIQWMGREHEINSTTRCVSRVLHVHSKEDLK